MVAASVSAGVIVSKGSFAVNGCSNAWGVLNSTHPTAKGYRDMVFAEKLRKTGDTPFTFLGKDGVLEGVISVPDAPLSDYVALIGHPNSLQGGSMSNKVVTTLSRAFRDVGMVNVRFNFRGVGRSEGTYDNGIGESDDLLALCRLWSLEYPSARFIFSGFSFGSYVTYRAAAQWPHEALISVAPPVNLYDYHHFQPAPAPWHVLMGDDDEVVPAHAVHDFVAQSAPAISLSRFEATGHFFHGRLLDLKADVINVLKEKVLNR